MGDGLHDLDLVFWYTGAKPINVFAQTIKTRPNLQNHDLGWAMFRFSDQCIAIIESIWCLPENTPCEMNAGMRITGTEGIINIDNSGLQHYMIINKNAVKVPESMYWPKVRDYLTGYLKEEYDYFIKCIINKKNIELITPEDGKNVVAALEMAEKSARDNQIIEFNL